MAQSLTLADNGLIRLDEILANDTDLGKRDLDEGFLNIDDFLQPNPVGMKPQKLKRLTKLQNQGKQASKKTGLLPEKSIKKDDNQKFGPEANYRIQSTSNIVAEVQEDSAIIQSETLPMNSTSNLRLYTSAFPTFTSTPELLESSKESIKLVSPHQEIQGTILIPESAKTSPVLAFRPSLHAQIAKKFRSTIISEQISPEISSNQIDKNPTSSSTSGSYIVEEGSRATASKTIVTGELVIDYKGSVTDDTDNIGHPRRRLTQDIGELQTPEPQPTVVAGLTRGVERMLSRPVEATIGSSTTLGNKGTKRPLKTKTKKSSLAKTDSEPQLVYPTRRATKAANSQPTTMIATETVFQSPKTLLTSTPIPNARTPIPQPAASLYLAPPDTLPTDKVPPVPRLAPPLPSGLTHRPSPEHPASPPPAQAPRTPRAPVRPPPAPTTTTTTTTQRIGLLTRHHTVQSFTVHDERGRPAGALPVVALVRDDDETTDEEAVGKACGALYGLLVQAVGRRTARTLD